MAKATRTKTTKGTKTKLKPWVPYSRSQYQAVLPFLVHFSAKSVNSKARPFGVRIPQSTWRDDLPYVAVSTTRDVMRLTYLGSAGEAGLAKIVEQVNAVQSRDFSRYEHGEPDADTLAPLLAVMPTMETSYVTSDHVVDERLRQVILWDEQSGEDVVLTPLHAPGLNSVIRARQWAEFSELDLHDTQTPQRRLYRSRATAYLEYGGSQPQNVGVPALVLAQRHPLWFNVPSRNTATQRALAIYNHGVSVRFSDASVQRYSAWRARLIAENRWTQSEVRTEDRSRFLGLMEPVLAEFSEGRSLLAQYRDVLHLSSACGAQVPIWQVPLLDATQQQGNWKREAAFALMALFFEYGQHESAHHPGHTRLSSTPQERSTQTRWIEEVLV